MNNDTSQEPYGIPIDMPFSVSKDYLFTPDIEVDGVRVRGYLVLPADIEVDGVRVRVCLVSPAGQSFKLNSVARQPDAPAVEVFDTFGQTWRVKAAPCGAGCYCAMSAELVYA